MPSTENVTKLLPSQHPDRYHEGLGVGWMSSRRAAWKKHWKGVRDFLPTPLSQRARSTGSSAVEGGPTAPELVDSGDQEGITIAAPFPPLYPALPPLDGDGEGAGKHGGPGWGRLIMTFETRQGEPELSWLSSL